MFKLLYLCRERPDQETNFRISASVNFTTYMAFAKIWWPHNPQQNADNNEWDDDKMRYHEYRLGFLRSVAVIACMTFVHCCILCAGEHN